MPTSSTASATLATFSELVPSRRTRSIAVPVRTFLEPGVPVTVGRTAEVVIGRDPGDTALSRIGLGVCHEDGEWRLDLLNGNGVVVHPHGLPPRERTIADVDRTFTIRWPRVAVRLVGTSGWAHWVLLDSPDVTVRRGSRPVDGRATLSLDAPAPLTPRQCEVLRAVYAVQLAWPPSLEPAHQRQRVSSLLGNLHESTIKGHVAEARRRALALGMPDRSGPWNDVEILHTLVAHGYLSPRE